MSPAIPEGESEQQSRFIKEYIHTLHGYWGDYGHLETHPEVELILIKTN